MRINGKKHILILIIFLVIILTIFNINDKRKLKELTKKEKIEDFEYMYDILKNNYPHFYELKKMYGYDWLSNKDQFAQEIEKTQNNMEFYEVLNSILSKLNDYHASIIAPDFYYDLLNNAKISKEKDKEAYNENKLWNEVLESSKKKYEGWYHLFADKYPDMYCDTKSEAINTYNDNIYSKIIETDKVAYLKVKSFMISYEENNQEKDKEQMINFFNTIKDYPYLIIDIMDNGGGYTTYWMGNIVEPLLKDKVKLDHYYFLRGGQYSMKFFESMITDIKDNTIEKVPYYEILPKEIKDNFKYYIKVAEEVLPKSTTNFNGKIFLLVNRNTFSAADQFANFCKQTKFATLVGSSTGGGGIGTTPIYMALPNSGLILRFEGQTFINEDGISHFGTGTVPDIEVQVVEGENYNQTVFNEVIHLIHSIDGKD
jgi:C-terminal processing protease CtpA/Prc